MGKRNDLLIERKNESFKSVYYRLGGPCLDGKNLFWKSGVNVNVALTPDSSSHYYMKKTKPRYTAEEENKNFRG
jgi:hypothetical protein